MPNRPVISALRAIAMTVILGSAAACSSHPLLLQFHVRWLAGANSGQAWDPALNGSQVVFEGNGSDGHLTLYIGDLRHWHPQPYADLRLYSLRVPVAMSSHWLVWDDDYPAAGGHTAWAITALSRVTGRRTAIDGSYREGPYPDRPLFTVISLHGDELAWSYFVCRARCLRSGTGWASYVAWMELPAGRRHVVASTPSPCASMWPSIWGNVLAWHQEGSCKGVQGSDVMIRDLRTGRTRQLTRNHISNTPVTNGRYVAWSQGGSRFDQGPVILLDLRTGKRIVASMVCAVNTPDTPQAAGATEKPSRCVQKVDGEADSPVISSSVVEWGSSAIGQIYARDLHTGREYLVPQVPSDHSEADYSAIPANLPVPWGHRTVWSGTVSSDYELGTALIP